MCDKDKIKSIVEAVEGIVKAVPVYQDAIQPAAKQIGVGLETITKTIHIALAPVSALVWGYEKISDFLNVKLTEKLRNVPVGKITTPNILVAGPVVESLRFAAGEETLGELYANLLATSIDSDTAKNAHPGFVEIIKNMSPDEARILYFFASDREEALLDVRSHIGNGDSFNSEIRNFSLIGADSGCKFPELTPNYLDNLCRLGILEIPEGLVLAENEVYEKLESDERLEEIRSSIKKRENLTIQFVRKYIRLTDLGKQFCNACVINKS
jgi:hypothetical protein